MNDSFFSVNNLYHISHKTAKIGKWIILYFIMD